MICVTTTIWTDVEAAEILGLTPLELQWAVEIGVLDRSGTVAASATGIVRFFNFSDLVSFRLQEMLTEELQDNLPASEREEAIDVMFDHLDLHAANPLAEVLDAPEVTAAAITEQLMTTLGEAPSGHPSGASQAVLLGCAIVATVRELLMRANEAVAERSGSMLRVATGCDARRGAHHAI